MRDDSFIGLIKSYYQQNRRSFDWRERPLPYEVFVSEIMLQQTQTSRVAEKFPTFVSRFPGFRELAGADLTDVMLQWQGLGYNRRARFLWQAAGIVQTRYDGVLPADPEILVKLPGIGPNTAASIVCFAYNLPTVFVETNIRTVFIHHFFPDTPSVADKVLLELIKEHNDYDHPRDWYYALMDYGVHLKRSSRNEAGKRAKSYVKQSPFKGSRRQARGLIIRLLLDSSASVPYHTLVDELKKEGLSENNIVEAFKTLKSEGLIVGEETTPYRIADGSFPKD